MVPEVRWLPPWMSRLNLPLHRRRLTCCLCAYVWMLASRLRCCAWQGSSWPLQGAGRSRRRRRPVVSGQAPGGRQSRWLRHELRVSGGLGWRRARLGRCCGAGRPQLRSRMGQRGQCWEKIGGVAWWMGCRRWMGLLWGRSNEGFVPPRRLLQESLSPAAYLR